MFCHSKILSFLAILRPEDTEQYYKHISENAGWSCFAWGTT